MPERDVELPSLPDVHVTFGNSAMCAACVRLADANAVPELTRRAASSREDDDRDTADDLVRLVVAAFGHEPPPVVPPLPEAFRHRTIEPLSTADTQLWTQLEPLIRVGPAGIRVRVRGVIEYSTSDGERVTTRALRDGPRARLADADDRAWLFCDGTTVWKRDLSNGDTYANPYTGTDAWAGHGTDLAGRRSQRDVDLFGFGTPLGPIEPTRFLGRAAWRFRFAAPPHKPFDMVVVVDAATGLVLDEQFGEHSHAQWTSFDTDVAVTDDLFVWNGPTVDLEQQRRADLEAIDAHRRAQNSWFAERVTKTSLAIDGEPVAVETHVAHDDGSFESMLDGAIEGALARRVRSGEWWPLGWSEVTHRWSDDSWDWALSLFGSPVAGLTDAQLAEFKRALGSR